MFLPQGQGFIWTFNPESRGRLKGRTDVVKTGYFVLEQVASGKLFMGFSKQCSDEVDLNLNQALAGNHPCKHLVWLMHNDPEFKVYEYPCTSLKDATRKLAQVKQSVQPTYLNLN